jgi:RNA polymerase sigma-70 factor (ECF subfamily)
LHQVRGGDRQALDQLLARYRDYLRQVVDLRLDRKLRTRVDASDVVQEAQVEVAQRIEDYLQREPMPFHLWLRKTTCENLIRLQRKHVEADCRSVNREMVLPEGSSVTLARLLLSPASTPSQHVAGHELAVQLGQAIGELSEEDREILLLRNYEGLSNPEIGQLLEIDPATVSKRYGRAILRLRKLLQARGLMEA